MQRGKNGKNIKSRLKPRNGDFGGNAGAFLMSLIRNAAIWQTNVIKWAGRRF